MSWKMEFCPLNQKRGILTLLPKKQKLDFFQNVGHPFHNIYILNTDYKFISKLLAKRLQKVLPSIINHDQTVYLKGRYIGQKYLLIEDLSFFTKK